MAELKTKRNDASVPAFLRTIDGPLRDDCRTVLKIMQRETSAEPRMWGTSIVGFGSYHYRYDSGREGDWFLTGVAARKSGLTVYLMSGFAGLKTKLKKLGKHKIGKCCLYIKRLADVDLAVLEALIRDSARKVVQTHGQVDRR
jgi:hypothetical protein